MLSPHISSAFAQERQDRYRREAADGRLARRRARSVPAARGSTAARVSTTEAPGRAARRCNPSPAH
jgi:hypothetical protein